MLPSLGGASFDAETWIHFSARCARWLSAPVAGRVALLEHLEVAAVGECDAERQFLAGADIAIDGLGDSRLEDLLEGSLPKAVSDQPPNDLGLELVLRLAARVRHVERNEIERQRVNEIGVNQTHRDLLERGFLRRCVWLGFP
jgi:hypothetical protein